MAAASTRKRLLQCAAVCLFVLLALALRIADPTMVASLRGAGFDTLQRLMPRELEAPQPVRIVDVDEKSLAAMGQWPWSRQKLADLVQNLKTLGAATIVFDIVFPEPDRLSPRRFIQAQAENGNLPADFNVNSLPDSDASFAAALGSLPTVTAFSRSNDLSTGNGLVVKAGFAQTGSPATNAPPRIDHVVANLPILDNAAAGVGAINLDLAGEQGIARQIPLLLSDGQKFAPALAAEALRVAQGANTYLVKAAADTENAIESIRIGEFEIPTAEDGSFYVHYRADPKDLYVSASDVLTPSLHEQLRPRLDGHIVFVGTSAVGLLDVRTTPLGETVAGVSVHAQAVEQFLTGRFLSRPETVVACEFLFILLGGLGIATLGAWQKPWYSLAFAIAVSGLIFALTYYGFANVGILFDATFPVLSVVATYLASTAYKLAVTDREGRNMRRMFGHYVAPTVLADIERNPHNLKLGGEVRDVTVMFVDIANFTPLSEKLPPEELVNVVNGLWNVCSRAVLNEQGTIDKFIGDAIMAFWNAPVTLENHQYHAARAAIGIREAVRAYGETPHVRSLLAERGIPPIAVRIGLSSGPACVGNMGSDDRFDYSVLGETVNTAARTESTCKNAAHDILISGRIDPAASHLAMLNAGHMAMKGKSRAEPVFALVGDEALREDPAFQLLKKEHDFLVQKMRRKQTQRNLHSLAQLFDEIALHYPACANYLRAIPGRAADFETLKPGHDPV